MKKASILLLVVFLMASTFTGGFFLGRQMDRSEVRISQAPTVTTAPIPASSTGSPPKSEPVGSDALVNINTATVPELATLPTIGEVIAQRIVDYRQANGPFQSIGELTEVEGIGQKRMEAILDYITIGGQT